MIAVVDDNPRVVELLRRAFEKEGYRVESAPDGVRAYDLVRSPECRCLVLDLNMPRINGVELLMLMQAEGVKVPTVVMAAQADITEREMKAFGNVVRLFHKPFELQEMLTEVRRWAGADGKGQEGKR